MWGTQRSCEGQIARCGPPTESVRGEIGLSVPGPRRRGTGGTLIKIWNGQRDRGHPPLAALRSLLSHISNTGRCGAPSVRAKVKSPDAGHPPGKRRGAYAPPRVFVLDKAFVLIEGHPHQDLEWSTGPGPPAVTTIQLTGALPGFIFHSENAITYKTIRLTSGIIISSESAPANPAFEKIFQYGITKIGKTTKIATNPAIMRIIVTESKVSHPSHLELVYGLG